MARLAEIRRARADGATGTAENPGGETDLPHEFTTIGLCGLSLNAAVLEDFDSLFHDRIA